VPVCLWKFLAILEVSGRQPGYVLHIQFPAVISAPGTIQVLNTVWKDKSIACWLSGMICSCWRPSSLRGIRRGEDQRHSPTWGWSSHTLHSRKPMTPGSSLFFVSSSPTAISCHLTRASVHDHVALFFQCSIYSVVNTEWHLPLTIATFTPRVTGPAPQEGHWDTRRPHLDKGSSLLGWLNCRLYLISYTRRIYFFSVYFHIYIIVDIENYPVAFTLRCEWEDGSSRL